MSWQLRSSSHCPRRPPSAGSRYIIIGGIAGWAGSKIVRGGGSGILFDIVVGVIGGYVGGALLGWLGVDVEHGHRWFTFFTALLGAIILLFVVRLVRGVARR